VDDAAATELPLAECIRLARLALDDGADGEWTACQRAIGYVRAVARNPEAERECLPLGATLAFMTKHAASLRSSLALCGIQGLADVLARLTSPAWDEFDQHGGGLDSALDAALQVLLQKQSSLEKKFLADASAQALQDIVNARPCALLLRKLVRKRVSKNAKLVAAAAHWALCVARAVAPLVLITAVSPLDDEPDALEDIVEIANGRSAEARPLALEMVQLIRTAFNDDVAFKRRLSQLWPDASEAGAKMADILHKLAPPQPVVARVPIRVLRAANNVNAT